MTGCVSCHPVLCSVSGSLAGEGRRLDGGRMSDGKGKRVRTNEGGPEKNGGMALKWLSRRHHSRLRKVGRFALSERAWAWDYLLIFW